MLDWIVPDWPAPARVRACVTTRNGGYSQGPYAQLNLAEHVGDDPLQVQRNRLLVDQLLGCQATWLNQVHSCDVVAASNDLVTADASYCQ